MKYFLLAGILFFLSSCTSKYSFENRLQTAKTIKINNSFDEKVYSSKKFDFNVFYKIENSKKPLKIYIEGDGLAWINRYKISSNPTPINPIAFKLAALDKYENILYLPRVCQYNSKRNCSKIYWTDKRFSKEIIENTNEVITQLKKDFNIKELELIGFSGGAAISVLLASKRDDIKSITTIAGNLNHKLLHKMHNIPSMNESLNPIDFTYKVENIKQTHYIGLDDEVVYKEVIGSFVNSFKDKSKIELIEVNATHTKGWVEYFKIKNKEAK